jgi:DNA invertase Pin-like site-specific DNA recombinase
VDTTTAEQNVTGCDTSSNRMDAGQSVQSQDPSPATGTPQLAERRQLALRLLVIGKSVARVARELEVSRQTIYRWREDPQFESELKQLRDQAWAKPSRASKGCLSPP